LNQRQGWYLRLASELRGVRYWSLSDDPGSPLTRPLPLPFNIRFPGQYYDSETKRWDPALNNGAGGYVAGSGLHYNRFRYYSPELGRYISADPIGIAGGDTNVYTYTSSNPVNWFDLLGLASLTTVMNPNGTSMTTFDPRPEDPNGNTLTIETRNNVASNAQPGAADPFSTPGVNVVPQTNNPTAYGPNGVYIDTGDARGRDIHGGGSCRAVSNPTAPVQGWCPTLGCTRGQNWPLSVLADRIKDFKKRHPGVKIPYTRKRAGTK
jgi:RHS repeat-associated protein